jgi:competence protein ComEC
MRAIVLGVVAGAWLMQRQAAVPGSAFLAALIACAALLCVVRTHSIARILVGAALGFVWAATLAHYRVNDALAPGYEGADVTVVGVIAGLPQPVERGVRFLFDVEESREGLPRRVLLSWYNGLSPEEFQEIAPVRAGER